LIQKRVNAPVIAIVTALAIESFRTAACGCLEQKTIYGGYRVEVWMANDPSAPRAAFWKDKIALRFTLGGILLMIFTVLWRINPAEGSVIPHFLKQNSFGTAVLCFLLATSTPV